MGSLPIPLVLLITLPSLFYLVHAQLGASHGEACGSDIPCNPRSLLACINDSCGCIKPKEMTFDKDSNKCLVRSMGKCIYPQEEKLDCVKNAECRGDGYCHCVNPIYSYGRRYSYTDDNTSNQYYGNPDGFCIPNGLLGENCTIDQECRSGMNLKCQLGICSCLAATSVFDKAAQKCLPTAGTHCHPDYNPCVTNAGCHWGKLLGLSEDHYFCVCSSGYLRSGEDICLPAHGTACDRDIPCHEEFACIDGSCQCPFSTHQEYNSTSGKCVSHAGGPCLEKVGGQLRSFSCADMAQCKNSTGGHECSCIEGWIESERRLCRPAHGQPCSNRLIGRSGRPYLDNIEKHYDCDPAGKLFCRNEKCACPSLEIYDEGKRKCRGAVGAQCSVSQLESCITGAFCKPFRIPGSEQGICRCRPGYVTTAERNCQRDVSSATQRPGDDLDD